jgi:hypothetical protein
MSTKQHEDYLLDLKERRGGWLEQFTLEESDVCIDLEGREYVMIEHTYMDDDDDARQVEYQKVLLPDMIRYDYEPRDIYSTV